MNSVVVDYIESGRITSVFSTPNPDWASALLDGEARLVLAEVDIDEQYQYVLSGEVLPRQPFAFIVSTPHITANGLDESIITNIPAGTTVQWPDGQTDEVTDGEVRFAVDLPGTYTLTFTAVPYLDQEVTIEALAAT